MEGRRLFIIVGGSFLAVLAGWLTIFWLNNNCSELTQGSCRLMWGLAAVAVLGGFLLTEILLTLKESRGEWRIQVQDSPMPETSSSNWYIWFRPIAWVILSGLLAGLPLVVQGSFVITLFGTATGFFLAGLIRGIMNRLPPIERDN